MIARTRDLAAAKVVGCQPRILSCANDVEGHKYTSWPIKTEFALAHDVFPRWSLTEKQARGNPISENVGIGDLFGDR